MGSAVFAWITIVTDRLTDRQTDHGTPLVTIGRIYIEGRGSVRWRAILQQSPRVDNTWRRLACYAFTTITLAPRPALVALRSLHVPKIVEFDGCIPSLQAKTRHRASTSTH